MSIRPNRSTPRTPEDFVSANGMRLCWDSFGDPADPPVILIMGMGAQMIGWDDEFCLQLAARRFRVIRFDNRDVGKSSRVDAGGTPEMMWVMTLAWWGQPIRAPYRLEDMARDVVGLMDALDIPQAHVVGASMGASIAQTLAIHHADRLLSLTSIMSTPGDVDLLKPTPAAMAAVSRSQPQMLDRYVAQYVETWGILRAGHFPEEAERDRARAIRNHSRGLNPAGSARHLAAILASGSRRLALRNVSVPTLVIHGDIDPLVPLAAGISTARSIPGADLLVLERMGHAMPAPLWPRMIDGIVGVAGRATARRGQAVAS
jgi:pimeloyl-ACP methyl ester carboxylesterase